jgi:hypothetical protein
VTEMLFFPGEDSDRMYLGYMLKTVKASKTFLTSADLSVSVK